MLLDFALATSLLASATFGWTPTGVKVIDGRASGPRASADGAGGVLIQWLSEENYSSNFADALGMRINSGGTKHPAWPPLGAPIADEPIPLSELPIAVAPGLEGCGYWTWSQRLSDGHKALMLKRTLADGTLDPAWPVGGIDVMSSPMDLSEARMGADGDGGVFIVWREEVLGAPANSTRYVRGQHILASGAIAAGWPTGGHVIASANPGSSSVEVIPDGTGGAYFKYNLYDSSTDQYTFVQRILENGSIAPGWPANGMRACTFASTQYSPQGQGIVSDGAGGVYVSWDDMRDMPPGSTTLMGDIYMARLAPDGTRPAGWPAEGLPVHTAAGRQWFPRLCGDGVGGVLVVWTDYAVNKARLTRITATGAQAGGWPGGGTVLCTAAGFSDHTHIVSDGQGGAYAGWLQEQGLVRAYAQHFRGDGVLAPGWAITGTLLVDLPNASQNSLTIVPGEPGNAIVVWKDIRDADTPPGSIRAQKLVTDGLVPVQLALQSAEADAHGVRLAWWGAGALGESFFVERSGDGESWTRLGAANTEGTERLTFEDRDVRAGDHLAYRLVDASNRVIVPAAWVEVPRALEFALAGARPNPARLGALTVELSLAEQASGTLELLDLAGRRVAWRELASLSPGRHTIPFPETASLAPGMHWLRLRQGVRETTARVVLTR